MSEAKKRLLEMSDEKRAQIAEILKEMVASLERSSAALIALDKLNNGEPLTEKELADLEYINEAVEHVD